MIFNRKDIQCQTKIKGFRLKIKSLCLLVLSCLLLSGLFSSPASAAQVYTRSFGIQGYNNTSHDIQQERGILYNVTKNINAAPSGTGWNYIYNYDWLTPTIAIEGNSAALYWETNIVAQSMNPDFESPFKYLDQLHVLSCGSRTVNQQSVSYVVTPWYEGQYRKYTLTIYASASLTGFTSGTQDDVRCTVGTDTSHPFIPSDTSNVNTYQIYFEKNVINYVFSDTVDNSLLQVLIDQNSTFFQQNINTYNMQKDEFDQTQEKIDNLNDSVEDLNDSITDDTVSGDFSMPDVPSFGPIATIVNSIIDLPRVFLTPGTCQDLVGPMPILTDQNFVIPCPKKLLEPFWDAVVVIENFFAVYIWFRVAMYIVRQVKKLRDPTNDDEEYLDL